MSRHFRLNSVSLNHSIEAKLNETLKVKAQIVDANEISNPALLVCTIDSNQRHTAAVSLHFPSTKGLKEIFFKLNHEAYQCRSFLTTSTR